MRATNLAWFVYIEAHLVVLVSYYRPICICIGLFMLNRQISRLFSARLILFGHLPVSFLLLLLFLLLFAYLDLCSVIKFQLGWSFILCAERLCAALFLPFDGIRVSANKTASLGLTQTQCAVNVTKWNGFYVHSTFE